MLLIHDRRIRAFTSEFEKLQKAFGANIRSRRRARGSDLHCYSPGAKSALGFLDGCCGGEAPASTCMRAQPTTGHSSHTIHPWPPVFKHVWSISDWNQSGEQSLPGGKPDVRLNQNTHTCLCSAPEQPSTPIQPSMPHRAIYCTPASQRTQTLTHIRVCERANAEQRCLNQDQKCHLQTGKSLSWIIKTHSHPRPPRQRTEPTLTAVYERTSDR